MAQEQNPLLPEKRGVRNLLIGVGGLSALFGFTVLVGWYTNHLLFLQLTSTSASMAYNLALIFLLCGSSGLLAIAIVLVQKERHKTNLLNEINHVLTREIAQHQQTEDALRKQTDIQDAIFACMNEGLMVADAQGKLLVMNRAAEKTLGFRLADAPADAPGNGWAWLAHIYLPDQQTPFPAEHLPLVRALRLELVRKKGNIVLVDAQARLIRDKEETCRSTG
jgi:PAS domain-containing protein